MVNWHAVRSELWNLQVCMPTCLTSPPQRTEPPGKRILWDEVFSPPNQYCRIGMLDIFAFVGFTLGMLFSAIIFKYSGYFGVFGTCLGIIHFCLAFFPILVLNWSKFHPSIMCKRIVSLSSVCFWEELKYWSSSTSFYLCMKLKGHTERKVKSSWETLVGHL